VPSWLVRWAPQLRHEIAHIDPQRLGDLEDLDEVEPPLPAFVLGDERLWSPEPLCELDLGQALGMTAGDQPVAKASIGRTEDGPGHGCCHAIVAGTLIRGWDYPNMGYDQCLRSRGRACLKRAPWLHVARREGGTVLDLEHTLISVRDRIAKHQRQGIGEQDTKAALIVPILRALGWDVEDLEEVKLEYRRRPSDNPVDYALFLLRTPRLFIEAKSLGAHINDGKWASQILAYATVAGVEWVALTDGNEWRIYNSHAPVPVEQKLFRVVRVADPESNTEQTLKLLAKAQMADHLIDAFWKSDFVDRQIRDALGRLFGPEPDPSLVRLIRAKATGLNPAEVRASLSRLRTTFDFPVVAPAPERAQEPREPKRATGEPSTKTQTFPKKTGEGTPWRHVTLRQLISTGLVRVPFDIEHRYRGVQLAARIEDSSRIVFQGTAYDSLSTAGGVARRSIAGPFPGRDIPQTNGWTFWQFRGSDGTLRVLDDLRRELHERKVVNLSDGRRAEA